MNENTQKVISLYDGTRTSIEIARVVGLSPRYVRRIAKKYDLPRLSCGAQAGSNNHRFVSGRRIDLDGYVLVTAPLDHPYARLRPHRKGKLIYEHRLVMEQVLGRYLLPLEAVDHIDGLTLHNHPSNLRLFEANAEHLKATITDIPKRLSASGRQNIQIKHLLPEDYRPVDTYGLRRGSGDVRLRQILLAWLQLDKDNPSLLGTHRHLKKVGIDWSSRSSLEDGLFELYVRWARLLAL